MFPSQEKQFPTITPPKYMRNLLFLLIIDASTTYLIHHQVDSSLNIH